MYRIVLIISQYFILRNTSEKTGLSYIHGVDSAACSFLVILKALMFT